MTITLQAVNELIASLDVDQRAEVPEAGESVPAAGCGECGAEAVRARARQDVR